MLLYPRNGGMLSRMTPVNRTVIICAAAILLASLAACGRSEAVSQSAGECRAVAERFDAALSGASGACRTDADCACYKPVSRRSGCGGITDKKTADTLRKLEVEFHRAKCDWWVRCAPWACRPVCARGRCINGR